MLEQNLKSNIRKLWDKFWSGGITNPLTAIEQMSYLIFMNRLEVIDDKNVQRAKDLGENYISVFEDYEDCRWSKWKHFPGEDMLRHVRDAVFPFIKKIRRGEDTLFAESMQDAVFLIPKPSMLQEAVSIIDSLDVTNQNQDVQGDIYEYLLGELKTSGKNGQFRTPRHIIRMITKLVNPKLGQKICDPFSGTGGFLTVAHEFILESNTSKERIKYDEDGVPHNIVGDKIGKNKEAWRKLKRDTLFGFDNDTTMIRIALMNMILHGIEHPNIRYSDSLSKDFKQAEGYDVILTNPPFTGSIDKSDLNNNFKIKTKKTELLALELFYNILHNGGRAGVIVPDGVLFTNSNAHKDARKILLDNCQLEAVISMPSGVFQPYSGVSTSALIFTKGGKTDKVWFYEMKNDGFTLDQKREKIDGKGDIPDIMEKSKNKEESEQSFFVDAEEIRKNDYNLSFRRYKKLEHEEIKYGKPTKIIEEILKEENEIIKELEALREKL
jgi:type I restriction enzyme M protein